MNYVIAMGTVRHFVYVIEYFCNNTYNILEGKQNKTICTNSPKVDRIFPKTSKVGGSADIDIKALNATPPTHHHFRTSLDLLQHTQRIRGPTLIIRGWKPGRPQGHSG